MGEKYVVGNGMEEGERKDDMTRIRMEGWSRPLLLSWVSDNEKCRIYCSDKSTYRESQPCGMSRRVFKYKLLWYCIIAVQGKMLQEQPCLFLLLYLFHLTLIIQVRGLPYLTPITILDI